MAFKMVALLRKSRQSESSPQDTDEQEGFLQKLPGVERAVLGNITGSPRGEVDFFRMIEVYFKDKASAEAALNSSEARGQAQRLFKGKARIFYVDEQ